MATIGNSNKNIISKEEFINMALHTSKKIMVVGIGTDKCVGDLFGCLTAQMIKDSNLKNIEVRGHFEDLFHALNVNNKARELNSDKYFIIALDSSIGESREARYKNMGVKPGAGLGKFLTMIEEVSITRSIASVSDELFGHNIRLGDFYEDCKNTAKLIKEIDDILEARKYELMRREG